MGGENHRQHSRRQGCCQQVSECSLRVVSQCAKVLLDIGNQFQHLIAILHSTIQCLLYSLTLYNRTQELRNEGRDTENDKKDIDTEN